MAVGDVVGLSGVELFKFAVVPVLNRTIVAGDTAVNLGGAAAFRAFVNFAFEITVFLTYGIGRAHGVIRKFVVFGNLPDQVCRGFPVGELLPQERVENGAGGVESLKFVLNVQGLEDVCGVAYRQVRAVGVVRSLILTVGGGDDVRIILSVVFRQTVGSAFGRGGLEVVEVAVLFLIVAELVTHEVERLFGEFLRFFVREIDAQPFCVEARFVHAHKADGGKVIVEGAEITFGVRIQAFFQKLGNDVTFDFQASCGQIHQLFKALEKFVFVLGKIRDPRHIYGYDTHGTRAFAAAEEAARFFPQFPKIQTQSAAHGPDVRRLHIAVDVVAEIRGAVFCGHFEEKFVVFGF